MASPLQDKIEELKSRLRSLEDGLIAGRYVFSQSNTTAIYDATKQLLQCVDYYSSLRGDSDLGPGEQIYGNLDELEALIDKFERVVRRPANTGIFQSIVADVNSFYEAIMSTRKQRDNSTALKKEIERLTRVQRQYEMTLNEMQKRANRASKAAETLIENAEVKTTHDWTEEYYPYVNVDNETSEKIKRLKSKIVGKKKNWFLKVWGWIRLSVYKLYRRTVLDIMFYNGKSYNNVVRKWRFWRGVWLLLIALIAIAYMSVFWNYDFEKKGINIFLLEKSTFLPALVVVSLGFAFASKNYKINSHLLEQYKHRYVVAKTMHNLMILDDLKGDSAMKSEVLQKGSKVLFEFRNTGYMSKHDNEQITSKELFELIKKES